MLLTDRWQTSCLIETCFITVAVAYGLGNRFAKADAAGEVSTLLFWTWLSCCLFLLNIASGKVAAVSFLLNLHAGTCTSSMRLGSYVYTNHG